MLGSNWANQEFRARLGIKFCADTFFRNYFISLLWSMSNCVNFGVPAATENNPTITWISGGLMASKSSFVSKDSFFPLFAYPNPTSISRFESRLESWFVRQNLRSFTRLSKTPPSCIEIWRHNFWPEKTLKMLNKKIPTFRSNRLLKLSWKTK